MVMLPRRVRAFIISRIRLAAELNKTLSLLLELLCSTLAIIFFPKTKPPDAGRLLNY